MSSHTITMTAGKDFLEACSIHRRETALSVAGGRVSDVSPMTWDGTQYVFTITSPEPVTFDSGETTDDDEEDGDETAHQAEVLQEINVSDVLRETAELLLDDDLCSPLVQQLEVWLGDPMTAVDPKHLHVTPMTAERVGRHVFGLAAAVLERQLEAAAGRLGDVPF